MIRAGVVRHPSEWPFCGYNEIKSNRQRYKLIDTEKLMELLGMDNQERLKESYETWINTALVSRTLKRESYWTESVAVGDRDFVEDIKNKLGLKVNHRRFKEVNRIYALRDQVIPYEANFHAKMSDLS